MRPYVVKTVQRRLADAIKGTGKPPCFDGGEQYRVWMELEQVCHTVRFRGDICEDCTVAHQSLMRTQNRCFNPRFRPAE